MKKVNFLSLTKLDKLLIITIFLAIMTVLSFCEIEAGISSLVYNQL
jgi:hypothetical protein